MWSMLMGLWGHLVVFDGILERIPENQHVVVIPQKNIPPRPIRVHIYCIKNAAALIRILQGSHQLIVCWLIGWFQGYADVLRGRY